MKIAVTGKGGVGKTTISAVLARLYAEEGKKVFAVDVDSDANLGLALGFSEEELESITPISKMRTWHKHICYYDSVESVRQRRALEAKNFRGFLRE